VEGRGRVIQVKARGKRSTSYRLPRQIAWGKKPKEGTDERNFRTTHYKLLHEAPYCKN